MSSAGLNHKDPNVIVRGTKDGVQRKTVRKWFCEHPQQPFVVPLFQRRYLWGESQCRQLLDDVINVTHPHFLGTVMTYVNDAGEKIIVDGQQRATTLLLLLAALRNKGVDTQEVAGASDPALFRPTYHDLQPFADVINRKQHPGDGACSNIIRVAGWFNTWVEELEAETRNACFQNVLDQFWLLDFAIPRDEQMNDGIQVVYERIAERSINFLAGFNNPRPGTHLGILDLIRNLFLSYYAEEKESVEIYHSIWMPLELAIAQEDAVFSIETEKRFSAVLKSYLDGRKWDLTDAEKIDKLGVYFAFKRYMNHKVFSDSDKITSFSKISLHSESVTALMKELLNFTTSG